VNAQPGYGQIDVRASFIPFQWGFFLKKPMIEIDGQVQPGRWGKNVFDLPAGQHTVRVYVSMLFSKYGCLGQYQATVHPGQATLLTYYIGFFWLFAGGSLTEGRGYPLPQLPAGQ
jgi:hypothetical protein